MENSEPLVKTEIKGRLVTYYLTTEEDLNEIKRSSIIGEIFTVLASVTLGAALSIVITKIAGTQQVTDPINKLLNLLSWVFGSVTIIFAGLATLFYFSGFNTLKRIKGSGSIKSLNSLATNQSGSETKANQSDQSLKILKATYASPNKKLDVTSELQMKISQGKLEVIVNNDIKSDPDRGVKKILTIEYLHNAVSFTKEYNEGEKVILP